MELKKDQEIRDGILYDKKNNIKIGQVEFDKLQVDILSYMSLTDKVLKMLNGVIEFKADDTIDTDYDEAANETWANLDEDNLEVEPFDEYSDKVDLIDTQKDLITKVEATKVIEAANTKEEAAIVQSQENENKTVENKTTVETQ